MVQTGIGKEICQEENPCMGGVSRTPGGRHDDHGSAHWSLAERILTNTWLQRAPRAGLASHSWIAFILGTTQSAVSICYEGGRIINRICAENRKEDERWHLGLSRLPHPSQTPLQERAKSHSVLVEIRIQNHCSKRSWREGGGGKRREKERGEELREMWTGWGWGVRRTPRQERGDGGETLGQRARISPAGKKPNWK